MSLHTKYTKDNNHMPDILQNELQKYPFRGVPRIAFHIKCKQTPQRISLEQIDIDKTSVNRLYRDNSKRASQKSSEKALFK